MHGIAWVRISSSPPYLSALIPWCAVAPHPPQLLQGRVLCICKDHIKEAFIVAAAPPPSILATHTHTLHIHLSAPNPTCTQASHAPCRSWSSGR